jgi:hypothetical protein
MLGRLSRLPGAGLRYGLVLLGTAGLLAGTGSLAAQTPRSAITQLFTFGTCGQPLCLDLLPDTVTGVNHGTHFINATRTSGGTVISFLTSAIGFSVSTVKVHERRIGHGTNGWFIEKLSVCVPWLRSRGR